jgi:hypothetical protein
VTCAAGHRECAREPDVRSEIQDAPRVAERRYDTFGRLVNAVAEDLAEGVRRRACVLDDDGQARSPQRVLVDRPDATDLAQGEPA